MRFAYHDLAKDDGEDETNHERKISAEMQNILEIGDNKHSSQSNDTTYDVSERKIKLFHITGHPFCMHTVKLMFIIYQHTAFSLDRTVFYDQITIIHISL